MPPRSKSKKRKLCSSGLSYEKKLKTGGYDLVIGLDEVGRGSLAGPVVAAAVCLKDYKFSSRVDDSKKMTPESREIAFEEIIKKSLHATAGINHLKIDQVNIHQATILAMKKALCRLCAQLSPEQLKRAFVLIDGNLRINLELPYQSIVDGDAKSRSISAASILAKVHRDRIMDAFGQLYPDYGFIHHKGYATDLHCRAIKEKGPLSIHRKTFIEWAAKT